MKRKRAGLRQIVLAMGLLNLTSIPWAGALEPRFEITPFGGYQMSGSLALDDASYRELNFGDGSVYGLAVGMRVAPADESGDGAVEFMWTHKDSSLTAVPNAGATRVSIDMPVDQFHLNGLFLPHFSGRARPYAIFGLGATRFAPEGDVNSLMLFSWALGGGVKVPLTSRLGLRFEAKWDPALAQSSGGVFCNSATGQCYVTGSGELINQFDFTAGLTLRL